MKTFALVMVAGVGVVGGVGLGACSSNYMPRSRGRVAVTIQDGAYSYVRDGQAHPHGWFGAGLAEAVAGNRAAEQAAAEYHDRLVDGVLMTTVGAVCIPATVGVVLAEAGDNGISDRGAAIMSGLALGCVVLLIAGGAYAASAEPYRWDAINLFNDGAELPPSAQLVPRPAPAKPALGMR